MKKFLDLHCGCGCDIFRLQMNPEEPNKYELVCDDCGDTIATLSCYSFAWVGEDEDAKDSD